MSWNGNDLFSSTLMGGMPSGADPHQYLTTDGDGKPRWEPRLAYEESAEVEIMPTTNVGTIWYSQKTVACPHNGAVKVGDTGCLYIDGTPYKYTAIEKVFSGGPPVVVQLDVEKKSSTSELIGLTDANKLLFYNCSFGSPSSTHTVSMTHNSTTIKTIDPKYLPSGSGGGMLTVNVEAAVSEDGSSWLITSHSHSAKEILEAVEAGMNAQAIVSTEDMGNMLLWLPLAAIVIYDGMNNNVIVFASQTCAIKITFGEDKETWDLEIAL